MYYSKNYPKSRSQTITVPRNYSGNTFRVIDETDRTYQKETSDNNCDLGFSRHDRDKNNINPNHDHSNCGKNEKCSCTSPPLSSLLPRSLCEKDTPLSSLLNNISVEDVLLLGIMLVIYSNDSSDPTLLLLLILLLAK